MAQLVRAPLSRVRWPLVGTPQGVCEMRPLTLPLPPPWGWSTEFMATPLTTGRRPAHLAAPALPSFRFLCCGLESTPMVAVHLARTARCSPLGSLMTAYAFSPSPALATPQQKQ